MAVIIETSIGQLTVDLYTDERPRCSKNFLKLCKVKYYNFSLFHSVQPNLVAQTGDPTATGRGGMSVYGMVYGEQARYFDMEVTPRIKHKKRGLLSMVNNGNGRHGSQFFITLGVDLDYLDGEHTVFGEVAEGFEVLDKLNEAYCDDKHRPYRDIRIFHTVIVDDPFDDPEGLVIPDKSPEPTKEMLESDRIGVDEEVDDTKGMTEQEVQELQAEREAKANAQLLEMVGDLPDADVRPPDNVLFVCKLNPVTTDEDLEMIFCRFGPIVSCEVIKDHKTHESLQYAFIEFEKPEDCESAYFKMDNVLIDDRRIHVDFSQSVSKLRMPTSAGKKAEEEKKVDQPKYVIKDTQRRDNNYDLVFDHDDLPEASPETKKDKKQKHRQPSDSDHDGDVKGKKKTRRQREGSRSGSRSGSPGGDDKNQNTDRASSTDHPHTQRREKNRHRKRSSSSQEDGRKKDRKTSPSEERSRKEKKKDRRRSPSSEEDRKKEKRRKDGSPSSDKDRKKQKKRKDRSPSSEEDRGKKKKKRSPSPEEDRRKKKKERRSSTEDQKKERKRKERSPSPREDRRKKKKKKERRHSSSEEDERKERRKKEKRRGDNSSSSHRDGGSRDRS